MVRNLGAGILGFAFFAAISAATAFAQSGDETEKFTDPVHSDLPLFGNDNFEKWPQHFSDAESGSFGCTSRVSFGEWALKRYDDDDEVESWYRIWNYGAFHCFAIVAKSSDRESLENAEARPSFFVEIGKSDSDELWALQIGARPGSDYLLLSREPSDDIVSKFTVLQTKCPKRNVREAGTIDGLLTRYCAINSRSELLNFARRMSKLEPLGEFTLVDAADDSESGSNRED
jgi:hypothetical protein